MYENIRKRKESWESFDDIDGLGHECGCLLEDKDGNIWIGGQFTTAGGTTVNNVAYWDGSAWNAAGSGVITPNTALYVYDIAFDAANNVYITGDFTSADGNSVESVAVWNSTTWKDMADGLAGSTPTGRSVDINSDGDLWVGGDFDSVGGADLADRLAIWNGTTWLHTDVDLPGSATVYDVHFVRKIKGNDIYIGYNTSGSATASYTNTVAYNDGTSIAYPLIRVTRSGGTSATLRWIKNETTGVAMYFDLDMMDGETLTLDCRPGNREIYSSWWRTPPTHRGGEVRAPVPGALKRGSDFVNFNLLPGDNDISVMVDEAGTPTLTFLFEWRDTYWSFDGSA